MIYAERIFKTADLNDTVVKMCSNCKALVCYGCYYYKGIEKSCPVCGSWLITVNDQDLDFSGYPR